MLKGWASDFSSDSLRTQRREKRQQRRAQSLIWDRPGYHLGTLKERACGVMQLCVLRLPAGSGPGLLKAAPTALQGILLKNCKPFGLSDLLETHCGSQLLATLLVDTCIALMKIEGRHQASSP